ncbi:MAG: Cu(I)-responsive transcriptional regulator [Granulosicoccus sp.]
MNISQAATESLLPAKTIRYYEEIDLVTPARRDNGYREFSSTDIQQLKFIQRSRRLGFSVEECRSLLMLYRDEHRASSDVKAIAREKIIDINERIAELQSLSSRLQSLVEACPGDTSAACPIIDGLAHDA